MKLTTRMRYGTRIVIELASSYPNRFMPVTELSRLQGLTIKYIEQILIPLRTSGIVVSRRGKAGGYQLGRPPTEITLLDIYNELEGDAAIVDCLLSDDGKRGITVCPICARKPHCHSRKVWKKLREAIETTLREITVASLLGE
ncbi:MAG: Rrf2 family transcriptional regulator [Planctomycetota bacterium]